MTHHPHPSRPHRSGPHRSGPHRSGPARYAVGALLLTALGPLAACSPGGSSTDPGSAGSSGTSGSKKVVVATHDSWAMPEEVLAEFTGRTGYTVQVRPSGDAGALTNKLVLTKGNPIADVVYGIDNTFVSRAVEEGVLAPYTPASNPGERFEPQDPAAAEQVTPVDYSDVCVNVDDTWFAKKDLAPPATFEDLTKPAYRDLFVTPGPPTSSPGLAFLAATVAKYGEDGWQDYWRKLLANGTKITSGWSDAYQVDFTAGGGGGDRPIVLSYASSPPFTIPEGADEPTTSALLDTCFRQVEYAGVLDGAANPAGAEAFVDFMVSRPFQEALPDNMYVFPVAESATLPALWARWAKPAPDPWSLPESTIAAKRDDWLTAWADLARR